MKSPGSIFDFHPSGWFQIDIFTQRFNHFIDYVRPSVENTVFLILDWHHTNLDIILAARENHVSILCLSPHTTHKMQPLDKSVMGALKPYNNEEIRQFLRQNNGPISHFDISDLLGKAYLKI